MRNCTVCNNEITALRSWLYCSDECSRIGGKAKKKLYWQENKHRYERKLQEPTPQVTTVAQGNNWKLYQTEEGLTIILNMMDGTRYKVNVAAEHAEFYFKTLLNDALEKPVKPNVEPSLDPGSKEELLKIIEGLLEEIVRLRLKQYD